MLTIRRSLSVRYALVAFAVHATVVAISLLPTMRAQPLIVGDVITYFVPAQNILSHGAFSRESAEPFAWEPYRTPGYPLAIAGCIALFGKPAPVLFLAAFTAGLAAWCAVRMTMLVAASPTAMHVAGILAAVLPNSLGLSAMMLTDAMAGHLTLVWLYVLTAGAMKRSVPLLTLSGVLLMALQSLKPTFNVAGVLVVIALALFYEGRHKIPVIAALVLASFVLPSYLAQKIYESHGVRTASLLGIETVREYLQVRYLQETTGEDYTMLTKKVRAEDRRDAELRTAPKSFYGRLYTVKEEKVKQFFSEHLFAAMRLMATEMFRQFAAPQEFFPQVFVGDLPTWGRVLGSLLTLTLWGFGFIGGWMLWKHGDRAPALMTLCVLLFFLFTGSVSHYVGARLRFPADMAGVPLMGMGAAVIGRKLVPFKVFN